MNEEEIFISKSYTKAKNFAIQPWTVYIGKISKKARPWWIQMIPDMWWINIISKCLLCCQQFKKNLCLKSKDDEALCT